MSMETIALPCADCPLAEANRGSTPDDMSKVTISPGGKIIYRTNSASCGEGFQEATGSKAQRIKEEIKDCESPDVYRASKDGLLGRLGILTQERSECPAFASIDITSKTQLESYFKGE